MSFNLAGKGPLYEEYKSKYKMENVKFWGFISDEDLQELYANSHLFVFPTLFEGMPTVVLEAMANQLPVVVSDVGATAELVDETNGFLIVKNNVDALVQAVKAYHQLSNNDKQSLSAVSRAKVEERFVWEKVAAAHMDLFKTWE